jgi:hypothetical protein
MRHERTLALVTGAALLTFAMPASAQVTVGPTSCVAGNNILNSIECSFDFSATGDAGSATVDVTGVWSFTYQCLHEKNGKPGKKYAELTGYVSQTNSYNLGTSTVSGTSSVYPPSTIDTTSLCANNKGPYTVPSVESGLTPYSWSIEFSTENDGSAFVEGTL